MASAKHDLNYISVFLELVEVLVHQVIYLREIYPKSIFAKKKKYKTVVMMCEHPWVNDYIQKTIGSLEAFLRGQEPNIDSIILIMSEEGSVKEKYFLDLDIQSIVQGISPNDEFLVDLQMAFVTMILRLNQVASDMKVSSKDIDWWIELGTTQTGALKLAKSLEWGLSSSLSTSQFNGFVLPVMAIDKPIKLQLYIETVQRNVGNI